MRKLAIAMALASTALAAPAVARDQSFYVGIEGGGMIVEDTDFDVGYDDLSYDEAINIDHKIGLDLDVIAGYDFGMFRVEGELGYKRASIDEIQLSGEFGSGIDVDSIDVDGNVRVLSGMVNLLLDFGDDSGWSGFVGPGIGLASVRYEIGSDGFDEDFDFDGSTSESDSGIAWQVTAGVRKAITYNLDFGVKYRFFNVKNIEFGDANDGELSGRFRSHSLLASLVYNFGAPLPPPPPPPPPPPVYVAPPPPATQTCPDGSVILTTDVCPPVYVPPPPPMVEPERG